MEARCDDELYQLEVFLAVVQTGSFTGAGKLLLTSQSGVSHSIADLERELGIILFTRTRNGVKLTEAGEQILPHAREMQQKTGSPWRRKAAQTHRRQFGSPGKSCRKTNKSANNSR